MLRVIAQKVAIGASIACAGDILAQNFAPGPFDARRTAAIGAWVGASSCLQHFWYDTISKAFPTSPLKRMVADQLIFAPVGLLGFFVVVGLLRGFSPQTVLSTVHEKFAATLLPNYAVWPLLGYVIQRFVPLDQRVTACNVAAFFWCAYLSMTSVTSADAEL